MKTTMIKIRLLALMLACALACALFALPATAYAAGSDGEEPGSEATGTWDDDTQSSDGHFLMAVPKSGNSASKAAKAYSDENVRIVECNMIVVFDWVTFGIDNGDNPIPYNATVDVQLMCDGEPYDGEPYGTATLRAAGRNGWGEISDPSAADWEYFWKGLGGGDHTWTVELVNPKLPYSYEHIGTKYGEYVHVVTTSSGEEVGYKYMVCSMVAATEQCRMEPSAWDRLVSVRKVWFDRYQEEAPAVPSDVYVGATFEASPGGFGSFPSDTYEDGIMLGASNVNDGWHHVFTFGDGGAYGRRFMEQSGGDYQHVIVEHFWEDYPDYPIQSAAVIVNITPPKGEAGPSEPTPTYTPGFRVTKQVGAAVQDSDGNWSLVDGNASAGDQKFEFTLKFYDYYGKPFEIKKGYEKYYKYIVTSANGKELSSGYLAKMGDDTGCRVELGAGDTVTVYNMDGKSIIKRYTITESEPHLYKSNVLTGGKLTPDGFDEDWSSSVKFVAGTDTVSGMIDSEHLMSVTFINTPESESEMQPVYFDLRVEKYVGTVEPDFGDRWTLTNDETYDENQKFTFTITIQPSLPGAYDYVVMDADQTRIGQGTISENEPCQVELGHNDSVIIRDLPISTRYTIVESQYDGYKPYAIPYRYYSSGEYTDTIREYLGDDTTTVTFINTPESKPGGYELPKTGGEGSMPYAIGGIAAMSLGLGGPLLIGRKRKHEDDRGGAGK